MKCIFDISTGHANWTWKDPLTHEKRFDLPKCWPKCLENPMLISNTINNWTQLVIYLSFKYFFSTSEINPNGGFFSELGRRKVCL